MIKPFKVLVVEDEVLTAKSLKLDIEDLGVKVLGPVAKGENSVDIALKENPDLILMDIRLSGSMNGVEAAQQILLKKKIPIVFMTGFALKDIKGQAQKLNPIDYLEKPVDINRIKQIIEALKTNL